MFRHFSHWRFLMKHLKIPDWQPLEQSSLPLYRQIYCLIKDKIQTGEWPVGSLLPAQRKLAEAWGIHRSTLVTALEELIAEGFLTTKMGSGTRVANATWSLYANPQINWNSYVASGIALQNQPIIQEINHLEFHSNLIRLGTGELHPSLLPTNDLKEIMKESAKKIDAFGYGEPKGLYCLREQISRHLKKSGITASPNSILVVSGALQAIHLVCFGLLTPSARLLLEQPSYLYSLRLFQSLHMRAFGIALDPEGIDTALLRILLQKHAYSLLYTIPTFHNPTGTLMSTKRRLELLELCAQYRLPILEDDSYSSLWLEEPPPVSLKSMDMHGSVLHIGSLSKSIGPGLRIGWITGPEPIIDKLADLKMQNDYGSSRLSEFVAAEWFAANLQDRHLQTLRHQLLERRQAMLTSLNMHFSGIASWKVPKGGFYIWLNLQRSMTPAKLFKRALKAGILLNPGNLYDTLDQNHLRLSYAYASPKELADGLLKLAALLQTQT